MKLADVETVGKFVLNGVERGYESTEKSGMPEDLATHDTLLEVLQDEDLFSDRVAHPEDLVEALLAGGPSPFEVIDGAIDFTMSSFVSQDFWLDDEHCEYASAWDCFKDIVKHERRFFDPPTPLHPTFGRARIASRETLLAPLASLFPRLKKTLRSGTRVWRARIAEGPLSSDLLEAQRQLGPPPPDRAGHSRMNPVGISYFYLGSDVETCLAEVRPEVGAEVWIGCFEVTAPLQILDLTHIPEFKPRSIFDPRYNPSEKWASGFLRAFADEISRPIGQQESQIEYIPTQVLAEFVRHQGYDGIRFKSSQNPRGTNVVIFRKEDSTTHLTRQLREDSVSSMRLAESGTLSIDSVLYATARLDEPRVYEIEETNVGPRQ